MKRQPVADGCRDIPQNCGLRINVIDYHIEPAIAVEIPYRKTTGAVGRGQTAAGGGADTFKLSVSQVMEKKRLFSVACAPLMIVDRRIDMPIGVNQIEPAVVVVIK